MMLKRVSARKTTFLKPKSDMEARGYYLTKLKFRKDAQSQKTEMR